MITEVENTVSFAPHVPTSEVTNLAAYLPQLPPEAYDMTTMIDTMYLLTTPLFGLLFAAMVFFLRRILKQFDKAVEKLEMLTEKSIENETVLTYHIKDDRIHDFSRRKADA